jgi:hypothetical protein
MDVDLLNAADHGALSGNGVGERNNAALQETVDKLEAAGGGTLFIPEGVYEFAGDVSIAVNTDANCSAALRITGDRMPTLLQRGDSNVFVITETASGCVGHVLFEGLHFEGSFEAAIL